MRAIVLLPLPLAPTRQTMRAGLELRVKETLRTATSWVPPRPLKTWVTWLSASFFTASGVPPLCLRLRHPTSSSTRRGLRWWTSRLGMESISDRVYSCCGFLKICRTSPTSTIFPAYMTATRSASWA